MLNRKLGRTGIETGIIGLGLEYLEEASPETVASVVHAAQDAGGSYIDLWMATPRIRDALGRALRGRRDKALVAGHLGSVLVDGKTDRSRDATVAGRHFEDLLTRLGTDHVDAAMLFFVDEPQDFDRVFAPGGTAELAARYKTEGKARAIGLSTHYAPTALRAVRSGLIDILMFPVNPAFDLVPPDLRFDALFEAGTYTRAAETRQTAVDQKRALYTECAARGVAIIAMKPFAAGWLFRPDNPAGITLSPVQCLHYALSQPGVVAAVPGCRSVEELRGCLAYLDADDATRAYGGLSTSALWKLQGACMYCDHCLPCPVGIDVGAVTRLRDAGRAGLSPALCADYAALPHAAAECTECGVCAERCPFGVDAVGNMQEAARLFA